LIEGGYDPNYGARPLKRFLQQNLENLIARKMIADEITPNSTITIDFKDKELVVIN